VFDMDEKTLETYREDLHIAAAKIANAMEDRDEAIIEALLASVPVNVIAQETGLTRQRIWQIGRGAAPLRLG
jgi:DNA-binding phage protein